MAFSKDVVLAAGFGVVAGAVGWEIFENFQNDQSKKSLLDQLVYETVLIDYPELTPFKDKFVASAERFARINEDFLICPETNQCEIRYNYLMPFVAEMGIEMANVINNNPDLNFLLDRMDEQLNNELEKLGIQPEAPTTLDTI